GLVDARGRRPRAGVTLANEPPLDPEPARDHGAQAVVHADAQARALDAAVGQELRHDAVDRVHRDGEADAGAGAGRAVDRGVHAHEPAAAVEERAAGVAGVDGGVRLYRVVDRRVRDALDGAAERAHDAGG